MIENCHKMAKMAGLAYLDGPAAKKEYKKLGYKKHEFISDNGAQCHVVWNDTEFVICFRGTEPKEFSDIKADLNAIPRAAQSGGLVHSGFRTELDKVWDNIQPFLVNSTEKNFFITGHSLGGAMATIAASRLKDRVTCLYTYGSPRVGNSTFVKSFSNVKHYRHVNNNDIVASVPFAFLGYRHHGDLRYINHYGNIRKMTPWQRIKDQWRGRLRAFQKGQPFDGAFDHSCDHYISKTGD